MRNHITMLCMLAALSWASAEPIPQAVALDIGIHVKGSNMDYTVNDRSYSLAEVRQILIKVARLDKTLRVTIIAEEATPIGAIIQVTEYCKQNELSNIHVTVLRSGATKTGCSMRDITNSVPVEVF